MDVLSVVVLGVVLLGALWLLYFALFKYKPKFQNPVAFCPSCGTAITSSVTYCMKCGQKLKQGSLLSTRPHMFPALIAAIMLLVAIAPLPYGYYQFLRWVICGVAIFITAKSYAWKQTWATWLFGAVAVLFNPIIPINLSREIWLPIDVIGCVLFGFSPLFLKEHSVPK